MQHPTPAQLKNAQERNKQMGTKPKGNGTPSTKPTSPKIIPNPQPVQEEFPFARQYNTIARAELNKDLETLLKHLDKMGCLPGDIDPIVSLVMKSSSRMRIQKDEREKERKEAAEAKKKAEASRN